VTIIDSSVLIAILLNEPDSDNFANYLSTKSKSFIAAPTYLETCMVATFRIGNSGVDEIQNLMRQTRIEIADFSASAAHQAVLAFKIFGKGQGHQAQLNFGDCISYAMSKTEFMPLLFKGDEFRLTDVECAL
jgi:ribonuclease VapC